MRRTLCLILAAVMLLCLCACGAKTPKKADDAAGSGPTRLIWWVYGNEVPNTLEEVLAKANAITAERIGVTVDMQFKGEEQFTLDLNTGEYYDMTFSCDWCNDFDDNARSGSLMNIWTA